MIIQIHKKMCTLNAHFFHVSMTDINRNRSDRNAKTVKGTSSLHCVKTSSSSLGNCPYSEYVEDWKEVHLYRQGEPSKRSS
ncbi:hypothetical protein MAR_011310 [Mya arenaria]|uniref:Uncharacterized protein n=1 Tax=Mya arenaria TaxID=6604 RepID=A0ABY7FXQ6_MYAAR|nr:hypothetical protein MAR_011310 [Mya arenaria]